MNQATRLVLAFLCLVTFLHVVPSRAAESGEYLLGAGDRLRISVFGYPDMTADLRVDDAGNIRYPLIGSLPVSSTSTQDVEIAIAARLESGSYIRDPQVSVLITEHESRKVAVMGEVARPGQYPLTQRSTVLEMFAAAGGPVTGVAADSATLLRIDGANIQIDLFELFSGNPEHNVPLFPGDTLYVPRAPQFYVYGEVQRPGTYRLERNMTVSQAISTSGGLTPRGTERRAIVKRRNADGSEENVSVRGADVLRADDVLEIKESLF